MNAPRRSDDGAAPTRSALSDLLRTHESAPPPATPPRRRAAPREARWSPSAGQPSLFGEILDWMLAPLLLLWPMSLGLTWVVAQAIANRPYDRELADLAQALAHQATAQTVSGQATTSASTRALLQRTAESLTRRDDDRSSAIRRACRDAEQLRLGIRSAPLARTG